MPEEIRLYYTSQDGLAFALKNYIDSYLLGSISDEPFKRTVKEIIDANLSLLPYCYEKKFPVRIKNLLGKKRLQIISQILEEKV